MEKLTPLEAFSLNGLTRVVTDHGSRIQIDTSTMPELHLQTLTVVYALQFHPDVFVTPQGLCRLCQKEDHVTADPLNDGSARHVISEVVQFFIVTETKKGPILREIYCPVPVVKSLLSAGEWPGVKYLKRIVPFPTLAASGSIRFETGYNPESRLFLDLDGTLTGQIIPENPQPSDIEAARRTLYDWLTDFQFESPADFAAALAALFTGLFRHLIYGAVPLWLISAPAPGTGKTLLFTVVSLALTGKISPIIGEAKDPAE